MKKYVLYVLPIVLLSITIQSQEVPVTLDFSYDIAGNQILRDDISITDKEVVVVDTTQVNIEPPEAILGTKFSVSPNPNSGEALLQWEADTDVQVTAIEVISLINSERTEINISQGNTASFDLSKKASGIYLVIFYLNNSDVPTIQKKIIKM